MTTHSIFFTDSHTHLADPVLQSQLPEILSQAQAMGVERFIVPSAQQSDWQTVLHLTQQYDQILGAIGIHPWFIDEKTSDGIKMLAQCLMENLPLWLGEIGLDYARALSPQQRQQQQTICLQQLTLAQQYQRPVILHNVRASADLLTLLKQSHCQHGIVHAFSGSFEEALAFIKQGFKIGLGSLLLNPHAKKIRLLAQQLPLEHIILETDSPFMLKNTINTPTNIIKIARIICEIRGISLATLASVTEQNIQQLIHTVSQYNKK